MERNGERGKGQPRGEEPAPLEGDGRLNGQQREQRQRRDGPEGIGSIDGQQATAAGVSEEYPQPSAEADSRDHHGDRELELVLLEQRGDALRTGPVGRTGEPAENVREEGHGQPRVRLAP